MKEDKKNVYKYKILNPGGNKTALVIGNEYNKEAKKIINDEILKFNKDVEQVGFLSTKEKRLEMAGGEFCVNATRCAVWAYLKGQEGEIELSVSGCKENLIGGINNKKEVYTKMPIKKEINSIIKKKDKFNLVNLDGILLAVLSIKDSKKYIKELKTNTMKTKLKLKEIMETFETKENAIGIILLEEINKGVKIYPITWVKSIDTVYFETACGSGSLAAAIFLNSINKSTSFNFLQPSNYTININLDIKDNIIKSAIVSGVVEE